MTVGKYGGQVEIACNSQRLASARQVGEDRGAADIELIRNAFEALPEGPVAHRTLFARCESREPCGVARGFKNQKPAPALLVVTLDACAARCQISPQARRLLSIERPRCARHRSGA